MSLTFPAIVLAAGGSTRCPEGKLFKEINGQPLITWGIETLLHSSAVENVKVIVGHRGSDIRKLLEHYPVQIVGNPNWSEGISSSLRVGISSLDCSCIGTLVCLADTPFFRQTTLAEIAPSHLEVEDIRFPLFKEAPGHPKYFPRWLFPEILEQKGDTGAKSLLKTHQSRCKAIDVDDPGVLRDYDRPGDFSSTA